MTKERTRGYCPRCGHEQVFTRNQIHHGIHLFLTIITLGLWLVSWVAIYIGNQLRPWRCQQCGWYKPMVRPRESSPAEANADESKPKKS